MKVKTKSNLKKSESNRHQPRKDSQMKRVNYDNTRMDKFDKDVKKLLDREDSNDIRWYSRNPDRIQSAARIPFSSIAGVTVAGKRTPTIDVSSPGVMVLRYCPNFIPNQAVVEQAYQNMYSDIVHANSRNSSYDYTDLAIMHMAGTELFAAIAVGIRAYGLMRQYTEQNVYTPRAIIKAAGFNLEDLQKNYARMWDDILQLIAQSRQIWLPNTMPIIERRIWMNLNVYKDSESSRAQYYLYAPNLFYEYVGFTDTKGGFLSAINVDPTNMTWEVYRNTVQRMIDALIPDQDRGIMYGDILKAYGTERIFAMNDIALDYATIPTYNPEVLWQIENLTQSYCGPVHVRQDNLHLYQDWGKSSKDGYDTGATAWSPGKTAGLMPANPMLNFHQDAQPTPEQIMIATRMTCCLTVKTDDYNTYNETTHKWSKNTYGDITWYPEVSGTEMCTGVYVYYNTVNTTTGAIGLSEWNITYDFHTNASDTIPTGNLYMWGAFDWAPIMYQFYNASNLNYADGIKSNIDLPIMEYDNWARISSDELRRLHNAALYSLYNVPTIK